MKQYKLLKDLPTFKAGEIFYIKEKGNLARVSDDVSMYSKKTMDNFPNILTDWFEEIHETYKRCRAVIGCKYYYLDDSGSIVYSFDHRCSVDDYRYDIGDYALAREELEAKLKYDIARQVLLDDAEGGNWIEDDYNWFCYYSQYYGYDTEFNCSMFIPGTIYFRTEEALEKSLKEHKEQWEIVRKYEMGEM